MDYTHDENCTCPSCLTWDDFDHVYIDFAMEYSQQMLTYTLGIELLTDFPKNLPQYLITPIIAKRQQVLSAEMRRRGIAPVPEHAVDDAFFKHAASVKLTQKQHRIRCAYEGLYHLARLGKKMPEMEFPQFERFFVGQNVVVICAFAEGFISNTIRRLCEVRPAPFNRWKKRRHNKLAGLNDSEVLELFVFEMGYGGFEKKMRTMEKEFDFYVPTPESDRDKIRELFLIRNCLVHNAGIVSKAYKQSSRAAVNLSVGDEMPLPEERIEELLDTLVDAVTAIYRSVSIDMLKKPAEKVMFGSYRNLTQECFEVPKDV